LIAFGTEIGCALKQVVDFLMQCLLQSTITESFLKRLIYGKHKKLKGTFGEYFFERSKINSSSQNIVFGFFDRETNLL
jgi:hypothetical protein